MRDTEIVGRDEELHAISSFLEQSDAPGALLIEGDAGIGKTTLWRAAARAASGSEGRVLEMRLSAAEAGFAFSGLSDLLASSLDEIGAGPSGSAAHGTRAAAGSSPDSPSSAAAGWLSRLPMPVSWSRRKA